MQCANENYLTNWVETLLIWQRCCRLQLHLQLTHIKLSSFQFPPQNVNISNTVFAHQIPRWRLCASIRSALSQTSFKQYLPTAASLLFRDEHRPLRQVIWVFLSLSHPLYVPSVCTETGTQTRRQWLSPALICLWLLAVLSRGYALPALQPRLTAILASAVIFTFMGQLGGKARSQFART